MTYKSPLSLQNIIVRSSNLVSSEIDSDLVILSIQNGRYYGTQIVGNRIWSMLGNETPVTAICDNLLQEFEVERHVCEQEVLRFLAQLQSEGLIEVR
jgi:hypothetical protein